jgi:hypothetical protein
LMRLRDAVLGQMDVHDAARLEHQLPHQGIGDTLIQVANVDCCLLILLPSRISPMHFLEKN